MPTPQEALSAALDRWNAGDLDGYLSLYDEESACTAIPPPEPMDKVQVRGFYERIFRAFGTPELEFHSRCDGSIHGSGAGGAGKRPASLSPARALTPPPAPWQRDPDPR
jgi:hypothetical protein